MAIRSPGKFADTCAVRCTGGMTRSAAGGHACGSTKDVDSYSMAERDETMNTGSAAGERAPSRKATVAVCTRERVDELPACLDSLLKLTYPEVELLVVDNAPFSPATERLVRSSYEQVRYVCEPRPGLNWARNRAIREATGEIIAYTDDDVIVEEGWLSALAATFEDPEVMATTGLVLPLRTEEDAEIFFERYGGFGLGKDRHKYPNDRIRAGESAFDPGLMAECGTGASMAFRLGVFETVGLFDPALDVGTATNGGGDIEMFFRIMKHGFSLIYEPSAVVRHRHRQTYPELRRQIESWGSGFFAVIERTAEHYPEERRALRRLRIRALMRQLWRLATALVRDPGFPRDLILAEIQGMLTGRRRYMQAREEAAEVQRRFGADSSRLQTDAERRTRHGSTYRDHD